MTKIVLRFSQSPSYAVETTPDQVVLHFPGARLTAPSPERLLDSPRVARLLVRGGEVTVVFREKGLAANVYALGHAAAPRRGRRAHGRSRAPPPRPPRRSRRPPPRRT